MLKPPVYFEEKGHIYTDSTGARIPSVTQIMGAAGLQDFSEVDPAKLERAMERGTKAHRMCELDDVGMADQYEFPEDLMGYLWAWRAYKKDTGAVILSTERLIWHRLYGYAGKLDSFLEDGGGTYWLVDRKTGPEHPAHEVQLGGYWPGLLDSAKEILPPDLDLSKVRFASVHLKIDGSYKVAEHDAKRGFATFLNCLNLYNWKNSHGLLKAA